MADDMLCPLSAISLGQQLSLQHTTYVPGSSKDGENGLRHLVAPIREIGDGRYRLCSVHNNLITFLR